MGERFGLVPGAWRVLTWGGLRGGISVALALALPGGPERNAVLAIVLVGENDTLDGPYYLRNPFETEPGWGVASVNYDLSALLAKGTFVQ